MASKLRPGLYDDVVSVLVHRELEALGDGFVVDRAELDADEAPELLARALYRRTVHALRSLPVEERVAHQVALANRVLEVLRERAPNSGALAEDAVVGERARLLAIAPAAQSLGTTRFPVRPTIPLRASDLLVNGHRDLSVGPEIKKELASADRVDVLLSFLKYSGFRVVEPALVELLARKPSSVRVITTARGPRKNKSTEPGAQAECDRERARRPVLSVRAEDVSRERARLRGRSRSTCLPRAPAWARPIGARSMRSRGSALG